MQRTEGRNGFVEVPDYWHLLDFQFWQRHVLFRTWNWNKDSDYWITTLFNTTKFLLRPNSINAVHSLVKNCRASRKQISYVVVVIVIASQISTTFCLLWHTPDYSQFNSCSDSNWHLKILQGSRNKSRFLNWHYYSTTTKFPYDSFLSHPPSQSFVKLELKLTAEVALFGKRKTENSPSATLLSLYSFVGILGMNEA